MRQNPRSIYEAVPALCPQNSAIYQQFEKIEPQALPVSGFSSNSWGDSLGRLLLASPIMQPLFKLVAELEEQELEGHFLNAASHMALNKDGNMVTGV